MNLFSHQENKSFMQLAVLKMNPNVVRLAVTLAKMQAAQIAKLLQLPVHPAEAKQKFLSNRAKIVLFIAATVSQKRMHK